MRFVLVGVWNTIFGYLVFVAYDYFIERFFSPRYVAYMSAAVMSNILAIINAYIFHKHITSASGGVNFSTRLLFTAERLSGFFTGCCEIPAGVARWSCFFCDFFDCS